LVDDFGCALFGPVLFVTLSYYGLQFLPLDPLYGDDYQVVCLPLSFLCFLCLLVFPLLPTWNPFSAVQKSVCAVTACSPCSDGVSVSHAGAELLSVSGICPEMDCLVVSGECTPSTAAGLLLKRHLCKSSCPFLPPNPSHALEYLVMALALSCIGHMAFARAAHSEHATAPCMQ